MTSKTAVAALRATADDFHRGRISHEQMHRENARVWDALHRHPRMERRVLAMLRTESEATR